MTEREILMVKMVEYMKFDKRRINHFIKVNSYANTIICTESKDVFLRTTTDVASLLHDIGIRKSEKIHGYNNGKLQEKYGVIEASILLNSLDYPQDIMERVLFLIGHHHTYNCDDGLDYQALIEADFIVNADEENLSVESIKAAKDKIFKTNTGKLLLSNIYKCN